MSMYSAMATEFRIDRTLRYLLPVIAGLMILPAGASPAGLIHQYQLNNSLADDLGGPNLVSHGGTLSPSGYSFGLNQGLSLSNGLADPGNYSIEIIFRIEQVDGWKKIIDFKNLTSDSGLYNRSSELRLYSSGLAGPAGGFSPNTDLRLILTRDGTSNLVSGYIDGVSQGSVIDSTNIAVASATDNILHFFRDDFLSSEASAGHVRLIRIYDAPMSADQAAALGGPPAVPEPSAGVLTLLALTGCTTWRLRGRIT
ncbi:MAG: hypothetical protein KF752_09040 [Pirellulaceae bacterium]|nr:hypothetical protein [Pirellulaceae bacterium]